MMDKSIINIFPNIQDVYDRSRDYAILKAYYSKYFPNKDYEDKAIDNILTRHYMKEICNFTNDVIFSDVYRFKNSCNTAAFITYICMLAPYIYDDSSLANSIEILEERGGFLFDADVVEPESSTGKEFLSEEDMNIEDLFGTIFNKISEIEKIPYSRSYIKHFAQSSSLLGELIEIEQDEYGYKPNENMYLELMSEIIHDQLFEDEDFSTPGNISRTYFFGISEKLGEYLIYKIFKPIISIINEAYNIAVDAIKESEDKKELLLGLFTTYLSIAKIIELNSRLVMDDLPNDVYIPFSESKPILNEKNREIIETWVDDGHFKFRVGNIDILPKSINIDQYIDYESMDESEILEVMKSYYEEILNSAKACRGFLVDFTKSGFSYKDVSLSIYIDIYKTIYTDNITTL